MVVISCFATYSYLYRAVADTYGQNSGSGTFRWFLRRRSPLVQFIGLMLPIYFIIFSYYFSSTGGREQDCWSFEKPAQYFIDMQSLVYYSDKHILIGQLMLAAFSVAFVLTIWNRIQRLVQPDLELPLWRTLSRSGTSVWPHTPTITWIGKRLKWLVLLRKLNPIRF